MYSVQNLNLLDSAIRRAEVNNTGWSKKNGTQFMAP